MKITLEVTRIIVITGYGADKIMIDTTLPLGIYPFDSKGGSVYMEAAKGTGADYVRTNFNIEPEIVSTRSI